MPKIAHLSDLHLQSTVPARQAQVEPVLRKINAMKPDLVVISGDVTDDGWDSIDELRWAKAWLEECIEAEWFAVPGNHDVGNFVSQKDGKVTEQRVDAWEKVFGYNSSWTRAFQSGTSDGAWCVHGYNSMVYGSAGRFEQLKDKWIRTQQTVCDRLDAGITFHHAVVVHSPFFLLSPLEQRQDASDYWLGPSESRLKFYASVRRLDARLICSGHVHQTRLTDVDGVKIAWAPPASGTWVHAPGLPNPPMPEKTGFFMHTLHDDGRVDTELIECAPMLKCIAFDPRASL